MSRSNRQILKELRKLQGLQELNFKRKRRYSPFEVLGFVMSIFSLSAAIYFATKSEKLAEENRKLDEKRRIEDVRPRFEVEYFKEFKVNNDFKLLTLEGFLVNKGGTAYIDSLVDTGNDKTYTPFDVSIERGDTVGFDKLVGDDFFWGFVEIYYKDRDQRKYFLEVDYFQEIDTMEADFIDNTITIDIITSQSP